jgi:hypothetical protein
MLVNYIYIWLIIYIYIYIYIYIEGKSLLFTQLTHETLQRQTNIPENEDFVFHEKISTSQSPVSVSASVSI